MNSLAGRLLLLIIWILLFSSGLPLPAQQRVKVAFYNVENLYDTIPSLFYDDSGYTPSGRLQWNTERYLTKICNVARVLDELSADIVGLAEIENEYVVRDLVCALENDYNYIYRIGNDRRGIDLAFLYRGDRFIPAGSRLVRSGFSREFLHVWGELEGYEVNIVVCHLPSQLNDRTIRLRVLDNLYSLADSLRLRSSSGRVILMGDFNAPPSDKIMRKVFRTGGRSRDITFGFFSPLDKLASKGMGSYAYDNRWSLLDNIILSAGFLGGPVRYADCGIFVREWMLSQDYRTRRTYPLRTFVGERYTAGFSDHLPVYLWLNIHGK